MASHEQVLQAKGQLPWKLLYCHDPSILLGLASSLKVHLEYYVVYLYIYKIVV